MPSAEEATVPADLSGFVCVVPLQLNRKADGLVLVLMEVIRSYLLLVLSYAVQVVFLYEFRQINRSKGGDQCHLSASTQFQDELFFLELVCVFVFVVQVFQEVEQSKNLFVTLYKCPTNSQFSLYGALFTEETQAAGAESPRPVHHGAILHLTDEQIADQERKRRGVLGHLSHFARKLR